MTNMKLQERKKSLLRLFSIFFKFDKINGSRIRKWFLSDIAYKGRCFLNEVFPKIFHLLYEGIITAYVIGFHFCLSVLFCCYCFVWKKVLPCGFSWYGIFCKEKIDLQHAAILLLCLPSAGYGDNSPQLGSIMFHVQW